MNSPTTQQSNYALKPDAQAFDEIRLKVVPRYKTSGLSGNEWRISVQAEFYRNGKIITTQWVGHDMEKACGLLFSKYADAVDNLHGFFASDGVHCDQEGCQEKGTYLMRIKKGYNNQGVRDELYDGKHRLFCHKHKTRGNSSLGDNDENYEMIGLV